jgi:hypothetical protein
VTGISGAGSDRGESTAATTESRHRQSREAAIRIGELLSEIDKLRSALLDVLMFVDDGDTASRRAAIQHGREALGDPRTVGDSR